MLAYFFWKPELPGSRMKSLLLPLTAFVSLAVAGVMTLLLGWLRRSTNELQTMMLQLRASEARAQHLACHDPLTGLANRALFHERLDHALKKVRRGERLALLLLDLDRFKTVNDTLGHLAGDALIREFGSRIGRLVRNGDTIARLGGDEFALLVPYKGRRSQIERLCNRILDAVREPFEVLRNEAFVGASIGVVTAPKAGSDRVELMRKADIALYRAKAAGGGCYRVFTIDMDETIKHRSIIEEDLRRALASGTGLLVHYQPQVCARNAALVGLEALVRWRHPQRGWIPPAEFVPIAEETGLIGALGEWVLRQACQTAIRWPDIFVAVNLSPAQLRTPGFAKKTIDIIVSAGVRLGQIELEVTEGILLDDDAQVRSDLNMLREAGIHIALDDFGTGYSSLSYLRHFAVDKIKIDRSFVQHLGDEVDSASIVAAVVSIGHAMGLLVTAEGVETWEQEQFLRAAGCDQMQGYRFSRPLPEEELARLPLARNERRAA